MALRSKMVRLLAVGLLSLSAVGFLTACDEQGFEETEEGFTGGGFDVPPGPGGELFEEGIGGGFDDEGFDPPAQGQQRQQQQQASSPRPGGPTQQQGQGQAPDGMGGGMGGQALGGSARTRTLAEQEVGVLPGEPFVWVAYAATADRRITHRHALGFVYATDGPHTVRVNGQDHHLLPGEALFIDEEIAHTHTSGSFWDILLAHTFDQPPRGLEEARQVFASPPLVGVPEAPVRVSFIQVELPSGAQTSVHSHPGPEYIYVTEGDIVYQNARTGTTRLTEGGGHALPPNTAVQKRNPDGGRAVFLSFFVTDPAHPFAPHASFERMPRRR